MLPFVGRMGRRMAGMERSHTAERLGKYRTDRNRTVGRKTFSK